MRRSLGIGLLAVFAGCPSPDVPIAPLPPVSAGKVRIRVFTEPSAVRAITAVGKYVFVATDEDLQRWDGTNVLALSADHGLPGSHVAAFAADPERKRLWLLTEGGLGNYSVTSEVYTEAAAPPASLAIDYAVIAKEGASLAPAAVGGVWIGTQHGLFFASEKGGWVAAPFKEPIRALARDRAGWLWIAAKTGLVARKPNGDLIKIGAAQGCVVVAPRIVLALGGDRVAVIGGDDDGHERIAIGQQATWTSYRALPDVAWDAATAHGDGIVLIGGDRSYRIGPATAAVRPLERDGVRLVAIANSTPEDWVIDPLDLAPPVGATALASVGDQLLIGTRDVGTARYLDGESHPHDWLRRLQLFQDATTLTVACARRQDCWVATGARQAWHWIGDHFVAGGPDQVVLAVVRDPTGPIYALHRGAEDKEIRLSRIGGWTWTAVPKIALTTPGDAPEVSFARFAGPDQLWVGLRYRDGQEKRAYGIAIVEPSTGKVTYHHTEAITARDDPANKPAKMLPIPVGVVDADVRGDIAWFATNEGIARLANGQVKLWSEANGLRSELARAVTIAPDGTVYVATGAGAEKWDGKQWDAPAALRFEINDVTATRNGQVWMATERGIAAWDGKKVRRVDTRRGLVENEELDVVSDQYDRVWARGPGSLTVISQ